MKTSKGVSGCSLGASVEARGPCVGRSFGRLGLALCGLWLGFGLTGCSKSVGKDGFMAVEGETADVTTQGTEDSGPATDTVGTTVADDSGPQSGAESTTSAPDPNACGNGVADEGEQCDQADFGGLQCTDYMNEDGLPFDAGTLACDFETCTVQTEGCITMVCGDGLVTLGELCDGPITDPIIGECFFHMLGMGEVSCSESCRLDYSGCPACGNGLLESPEECDGDAPFEDTCETLGAGVGELGCTPGCYFDLSGCA